MPFINMNLIIRGFFGMSLVVLLGHFSGCATNIGSQDYATEHVGEASQTYRARVVSVRKVKVGPDSLGKNKAGAVAGGVAGGVVGSQIGRGTGSLLGAVGGAVAGAVGGAYAEKALKTQSAYEYTVELKNGELRTVVQGTDVLMQRGQNVLLVVYQRGRSKILPDPGMGN